MRTKNFSLKSLSTWFAMCCGLYASVVAVGQDANEIKILPLKGMKDVSVFLADGRGFDAQQLKIGSELRLRQQGIKVKQRGLPVIEVNVHSMQTQRGFVVATLQLSVNDLVTFKNGEKGVAKVWGDFMTVYLAEETAEQKVEQGIRALIDGFCNDYLAANPPAREPAP